MATKYKTFPIKISEEALYELKVLAAAVGMNLHDYIVENLNGLREKAKEDLENIRHSAADISDTLRRSRGV